MHLVHLLQPNLFHQPLIYGHVCINVCVHVHWILRCTLVARYTAPLFGGHSTGRLPAPMRAPYIELIDAKALSYIYGARMREKNRGDFRRRSANIGAHLNYSIHNCGINESNVYCFSNLISAF